MSVSYEFKFKKDNLACMTVKNFHPDDVKKIEFPPKKCVKKLGVSLAQSSAKFIASYPLAGV